jgi:DNA-binding transcriptional regulator YhcF (GntR family)
MTDPRSLLIEVLRSRVLRGLQASTLRDGDRLPSARDLAREFGVDHRVAVSAYKALVEEGLVELRPRGGIYVAARPADDSGVPPLPAGWLAEVLAQGLAREIAGPELHEWLRRCTETLRLRAVVITTTTDQAHGLSRELRDDFGLEAESLHADDLDASAPPLPVRRADLIVATEAHATTARALGAALHKPVVVIEVRPELTGGDWAVLLRRPVYAVVATPEFGVMLREFFAKVPGVENLRIVVVGEDDLQAIPEDAPTYVTQRARARLGNTPVRGRVLPAARVIAVSSAREIFEFIVRANLEALHRRRV